MINPFGIEKALLTYVDGIKTTAQNIRAALLEDYVHTASLRAETVDFDLAQLYHTHCTHPATPPPERLYQCKWCRRVFDDGRKLGGHVSRKHKYMTEEPSLS